MAKRALPLLTGGLNEVTRSDLIEDSQLQQCDNYEITGDGVLRKRKSQTTYNGDLNDALATKFDIGNGGSILKISEPYYPQKKLVPNTDPSITMIGDYVIFVVGLLPAPNDTNYTIHAFWQNSNYGWSNDVFWSELNQAKTFPTLLSEAGITYPTDFVLIDNIEFTIGNNKVIINDHYNRMHYFEVDADGIANSGFLGIPAPLNKPCVLPLDRDSARGDISISDVNFEDDSGADYIESPGLAQITYTVVTKFGEESNPSPISDALDLQWFKLNEDTGANEIWIDSIDIYNLNIPDVPQSVEDILEKFKIYLRLTPYSQGINAKTLTFTEEFSISRKTTDAVDTGNDYRMTVAPSTGQIVSYENDVAPVAKTASELGGIIMTGNVRTRHKFPFDFKYVHPITINNKDSKFYIEPWFRIRLGDKDIEYNDVVNAKPIDNFEILDFIDSSFTATVNNHLKRSEFIRIYFEDQTTPCMLGYVNRLDNESPPNAVSLDHNTQPSYIDLLIKIPYLRANDTTTVYLVWTPDNDEDEVLYPGVPSAYNDATAGDVTFSGNIGIEYGKIMSIGVASYSRHKLFNETRVLDDQTVLAFDFSYRGSDNKFFNKADGYGTVIQQGDIPQTGSDAILNDSNTKISPTVLGYNNYPIFDLDNGEKISQGYWYANNYDSGIVLDNMFFKKSSLDGKSGFLSFWYDTSDAELYDYLVDSNGANWRGVSAWDICTIWGETHEGDYSATGEKAIRLMIKPTDVLIEFGDGGIVTSGGKWYFAFDDNQVGSVPINSPVFVDNYEVFGGENLFQSSSTTTYYPENPEKLFILISWDKNQDNVYIWIMDHDRNIYKRKINWSDSGFKKITDGTFYGVVLGSHVGSTNGDYRSTAIKNSKYMDVTMKLGDHLNTENEDDHARFINYANRGGFFEQIIGYKEGSTGDGTSNNNISFSKTELSAGKQQQNMIKWTDVNHSSFPDLNYKILKEPVKRIIAAPSFLQYQYQNTFLIFTRNTINRFVLEGSSSGWAASSSSLIEEKKQYGLLADKSLMRIGDAVFWLSEVGIVKWDSQGLNLISKNIVNIAIEEDSFAFYNSINNQYMLHQPSDGNTYVYHIDRNMWTKYTGLNIISTGILTGGSEFDNINLVLNESNQIDKFPSNVYVDAEDQTSTIKTKDLFFENGLLKRVRLDYEGGTPDLTTNLTKIDSNGLEIEKNNTITGIQKNKWRGIKNGFNRGRSVNIEVTDAEEIKSIMYDLNIESEVTT